MTARYCQPQDVRDILRGLDATGTGTAAELPDVQMFAAITRASSVVTSYVGTNYEADQWNPNPLVPPLVKYLTAQLSGYYATLIYRKGKDLSQFDPVYLMYQDVRTTFNDIISGKIEVNPGRPNEAPEHQGRVRQTQPRTLTPKDAGVKLGDRGIEPAGVAWGGYSPSPYTGYDQGE